MIYVIAMIDAAARNRLTRLRELAAPFGIPPRVIHGHITLAGYDGGDEDGFLSSCKAILSRHGKFSIRYERIEVFASTSAVMAVPREEKTLSAIHREISEGWEEELNQWTRRGVWRPHTTLVYHPEADLEAIAGAMRKGFEPFEARVDRVEFSREHEDRYEIIDFMGLS